MYIREPGHRVNCTEVYFCAYKCQGYHTTTDMMSVISDLSNQINNLTAYIKAHSSKLKKHIQHGSRTLEVPLQTSEKLRTIETALKDQNSLVSL